VGVGTDAALVSLPDLAAADLSLVLTLTAGPPGGGRREGGEWERCGFESEGGC